MVGSHTIRLRGWDSGCVTPVARAFGLRITTFYGLPVTRFTFQLVSYSFGLRLTHFPAVDYAGPRYLRLFTPADTRSRWLLILVGLRLPTFTPHVPPLFTVTFVCYTTQLRLPFDLPCLFV